MTREKLIELAREAGFEYANDFSGYDPLWKFGELVAAAERNRTWTQDHWTEYEHSIAAEEREACAELTDEFFNTGRNWAQLAAAIRARGQG